MSNRGNGKPAEEKQEALQQLILLSRANDLMYSELFQSGGVCSCLSVGPEQFQKHIPKFDLIIPSVE